MTRLTMIDPATAQGPAKALLDGVKAALGGVPNLFKVLAAAPAALGATLAFSGKLAGGALDAKLRERIALAVAEANGCDYCLAAHSALGAKAGLDAAEILAARRAGSGDPKAAAAIRFALRVVEMRGGVADADLAAVRAAGFDDGAIAEIVANVALNVLTNYVNRVADTAVDFPAAPALARAA